MQIRSTALAAAIALSYGTATAAQPGQDDSGAEGVTFIAAEASPTGRPLLLVGNEVSHTLAVFEIERLRTRR